MSKKLKKITIKKREKEREREKENAYIRAKLS
jgi:hypothetical protein